MRSVLGVSVMTVLTVVAPARVMARADPSATIVGTVTLTAADGRTLAGDGARVVLTCGADSTTRTEVADDRGAFRFLDVPVDRCAIEAELQGFIAKKAEVVMAAWQGVATDVHLGIAPLRAGVNVGGAAPLQASKLVPESCRSDEGRRLDQVARGCAHHVRRRGR